MKVFLDVNVIFDYLLVREKFQQAVDVLTLIEGREIEAYIDVHTFTYAFFHLKKVLDSSVECREAIGQLSRMMNVVGGDG